MNDSILVIIALLIGVFLIYWGIRGIMLRKIVLPNMRSYSTSSYFLIWNGRVAILWGTLLLISGIGILLITILNITLYGSR